MDVHGLAVAALEEVAIPTTDREGTGKGTSQRRSTENATGIDMETSMPNNTITDGVAGAQELLQIKNQGIVTQAEGRQDFQRNTGLQSTSSHNSQSTTDGHDVTSTPPTSTSDGFSSQSTNAEAYPSQLSQLSRVAAAQQPLNNILSTRPSLALAPTAGQKRTADGQVKFAAPNSPHVHGHGHSRNTSAVSNLSTASSRIGELSSELRTRLSYAMVKVNHGWQSNSIEEVESLASQKGSPTSSNSTLNGRRTLITSPRTAIANVQNQSGNVSASTMINAPRGDFDLYSANEQPSRTYESFWREHSTATIPSHQQPSQPPLISSASRSLAPPADIQSTVSSRRSGTPKFSKPPIIPGQGSNSSLHNTSTPRTPNRADFRDGNVMQTPTRKTIQEQDAIETLLFMSSPGNSGNMGHAFPPPRNLASPQQSPLRTEFNSQRGAQGRRVEFEKAPGGSTDSSDVGGADFRTKAPEKTMDSGRRRTDAIDRLLDEMADSSSDEEELVMNYASPGRVAAGRV